MNRLQIEIALGIFLVLVTSIVLIVVGLNEEELVPVPWIENGIEAFMLGRDKNLLVILSPRDAEEWPFCSACHYPT